MRDNTQTQIKSSPEHWARLRSMLLDPSQWWELRQLLGMSVVDGEELDHTRACTGVMPDTVECAYVCANAGSDFWKYQMDVSVAQVVSSRLKQWYSLLMSEKGGECGSCLDQRRADLRGADLRGAYLSSAYLRRADLRGADLRGANLRGADLRGADLRWADLRLADLSFADLRKANLTWASLTGAKYNQHTKFPRGIDPVARGMVRSER